MAAKLVTLDVRLPKLVIATVRRIARSAGVKPGQVLAVMLATYVLNEKTKRAVFDGTAKAMTRKRGRRG